VTALELSGYQEFDDLSGADWLVRQWKKDKDITRIRVVDGLDRTTSGYRLMKEYNRNADGKWRGGATSGRAYIAGL
jgi:hypothetical protein